MQDKYLLKYLKYKNKYLSILNKSNLQSGGANILQMFSICDQLKNLKERIEILFDQSNSNFWMNTAFSNYFLSGSPKLMMSTYDLNKMISTIGYRFNDPLYDLKVKMVEDVIFGIYNLNTALKILELDMKVNNINDVYDLYEMCFNLHSGYMPNNLKNPIPIRSNMYFGPMESIIYKTTALPDSSQDNRCIYRDVTCIGEKDVITLDNIKNEDIKNVVRVDKKCYDADELQKWLVNNSTVPHNRSNYTSEDLNKCVDQKVGSEDKKYLIEYDTYYVPNVVTTPVVATNNVFYDDEDDDDMEDQPESNRIDNDITFSDFDYDSEQKPKKTSKKTSKK